MLVGSRLAVGGNLTVNILAQEFHESPLHQCGGITAEMASSWRFDAASLDLAEESALVAFLFLPCGRLLQAAVFVRK